MSIHLSQPEHYRKLFNDYDTWLFDCDGVLWEGFTPLPGARDALDYLRSAGKKLIFVTNSAQSRKSIKSKFDRLGIQASADEIFTSARTSAVYLSQILKFNEQKQKVYIIGEGGLEDELSQEGIEFLGGTDPNDCTLGPLQPFTLDPAVAAVLIARDTSITYTKLSKALIYLSQPHVKYLATSLDPTAPADSNFVLPGSGSLSATLEHALKDVGSEKEITSLGKPWKGVMDCIHSKHQFDPHRAIMVGDRLETDIAFGQLSEGMSTMLVLTGPSKAYELQKSKIVPMYVTNGVGDLLKGKSSINN